MLTVSKFHSATVTIDGAEIRLRIKKLTKEEDLWFVPAFEHNSREEAAFTAEVNRFRETYLTERADRLGLASVEALPKEELPNAVTLVGLLEASLPSDEARAVRRAREQAWLERGQQFSVEAIAKFVTIEPGQIFDEDLQREITSGSELVAHYAARPDVLSDLVQEIFLQTRLTPAQKKTLSLLRASATTSAPSETADGPRPDATVASAEPSTTAATVPATAPPAPSPSGATASSSSPDAPSGASPRRSTRRSAGSTPATPSGSVSSADSSTSGLPSPAPAAPATRMPH